jgi:hypothetical protein
VASLELCADGVGSTNWKFGLALLFFFCAMRRNPHPVRRERGAGLSELLGLRGEIAELSGMIRQLQQSGIDSATAQLLISRKRVELEYLMKY